MDNPTQQRLLPVPNSTAVLVLGILSIVLCWCYGIVGITLGIIAIVLSGKSSAAYKANPEMYSLGSFNNAKAGKICAIIGLSISGLYLLFIIFYFIVLGLAFAEIAPEFFDALFGH